MPELWAQENRANAGRCVPVVLRVRAVPHGTEPETGGLLRFLLIRNHAMPAHPEQRRFGELLQLRTFFTASGPTSTKLSL